MNNLQSKSSFFSYPKCHAKLKINGDKGDEGITLDSSCRELAALFHHHLSPTSSSPTANLEITEESDNKKQMLFSEKNIPAVKAIEVLTATSKKYR